jgi:5-methylcytosine-specific restriction protein A
MKKVKYIIYRRLTTTDFFNINKPTGTESRGGGQSYIDIPISDVPFTKWKKFFEGIDYEPAHSGPKWTFVINSIGLTQTQLLVISQRRPATFSIRAQKLISSESNRVLAWHPNYGFPKPSDPTEREPVDNLVIYIVKTFDDDYWAGWFQDAKPYVASESIDLLDKMLDTNSPAGFIDLTSEELLLDEGNNTLKPFTATKPSSVKEKAKKGEKGKAEIVEKTSKPHIPVSEEEIVKHLFDEDESASKVTDEKKKESIRRVKKRNTKAAKLIRKLYGGKCQITGNKYTFTKKDGSIYSEVHHLIPLGEGGADSAYNLIVVSSMIHDMLHYAKVSPINLKDINNRELSVTINGEPYKITWHPKHAELINRMNDK